MKTVKQIQFYVLAFSLAFIQHPVAVSLKQNLNALHSTDLKTHTQLHGQHAFDFEIGIWKTHLLRLLHPLTGSKTWEEYNGTTKVSKVWNGRANLAELEVEGSAGHIEGLSLRLYNPQSHKWSLYFANSSTGALSVPSTGIFKNMQGRFYDKELMNGRTISVKFIITEITADSCSFEQSFSDDGGKTWEVNWKALDVRTNEAFNK